MLKALSNSCIRHFFPDTSSDSPRCPAWSSAVTAGFYSSLWCPRKRRNTLDAKIMKLLHIFPLCSIFFHRVPRRSTLPRLLPIPSPASSSAIPSPDVSPPPSTFRSSSTVHSTPLYCSTHLLLLAVPPCRACCPFLHPRHPPPSHLQPFHATSRFPQSLPTSHFRTAEPVFSVPDAFSKPFRTSAPGFRNEMLQNTQRHGSPCGFTFDGRDVFPRCVRQQHDFLQPVISSGKHGFCCTERHSEALSSGKQGSCRTGRHFEVLSSGKQPCFLDKPLFGRHLSVKPYLFPDNLFIWSNLSGKPAISPDETCSGKSSGEFSRTDRHHQSRSGCCVSLPEENLPPGAPLKLPGFIPSKFLTNKFQQILILWKILIFAGKRKSICWTMQCCRR